MPSTQRSGANQGQRKLLAVTWTQPEVAAGGHRRARFDIVEPSRRRRWRRVAPEARRAGPTRRSGSISRADALEPAEVIEPIPGARGGSRHEACFGISVTEDAPVASGEELGGDRAGPAGLLAAAEKGHPPSGWVPAAWPASGTQRRLVLATTYLQYARSGYGVPPCRWTFLSSRDCRKATASYRGWIDGCDRD